MRRYFALCGLLLSAAFLFSSCLKDDEEEVTLYDDTAITSFGVSTAKVLVHTTSSTGEDSTYYSTSTLSSYPFSIDQLNNEIFNVDSLPYGTDVTKALVSYSTMNNGLAYIENLAGDSLKYLSTSDSLDFSTARKVRVYASNGSTNYRVYQVKVNVHQEDADAFEWKMNAEGNASLAALAALKLVGLGDSVLAFGQKDGVTVAYATSNTDGATWNDMGLTLAKDAYKNVAVKGDTLYVLDGTELKAKAAGQPLQAVATLSGIKQLLGATQAEMYAYATDGALMVSNDNGRTWTADKLDTDASYLPTDSLSFASTAFAYADSTDLALLAGSRDAATYADAHAMVWTKIVEDTNTKEETEWMYVDFDHDSNYPLPRLKDLVVLPYGGNFIAFGGEGISPCTAMALANVYESRDGGLTWKANAAYAFPESLKAGATDGLAATVDSNNRIWLVGRGSGQVWSGRLNYLGWK